MPIYPVKNNKTGEEQTLNMTIAAYEQSLAQNFGLPESDKFSNQNFLSGALPSNTEIAKQKIEQAKKRRAESEKKGRAQ